MSIKVKLNVLMLSFGLLLGSAHAQSKTMDVALIGLFSNSAMFEIDGSNHLLTVGDRSPQGIRLLSVNLVAGSITGQLGKQVFALRLGAGGARAGSHEPLSRQVKIMQDARGMLTASGRINGSSVDMLIDTGATYLSLNRSTALSLGVNVKNLTASYKLETAGGTVGAHLVKLKAVQVGGITLKNVEAMVLERDDLDSVLLGMSFLARLDMSYDGNALILAQKERPPV